jgi:DNA-binding transcriptional LysR family regulator
MDVHLRDLRYFVAVAEEQHVTRAAERLFISQPALSKQLRILERQLGFALFERVPRGVTLTAQGQALLPVARELLSTWAEGLENVRAVATAGTLVVGMQTAVGRDLQQETFARFRERAPGWQVSLRLVGWGDPSTGLLDGSTDLAFCWLPVPSTELSASVLASERRVVVLPSDHRLASKEELTFAELADEPFLALPESAGALRDFWLATDARGGDAPAIGGVVASPDETFEAVLGGLGIVLMAEGNVQLYKRGGLTFRPVVDLSPAQLAVVWRTRDTRPAVEAFLSSLSVTA